jgi:hypothetical protein
MTTHHNQTTALPFTLETELEARISADPAWREGILWGQPRPGHREGQVRYHIAEVLANVDQQATAPEERRALRLITLLHDTLKFRVDPARPRTGENHHGALARRFAERYLDDIAILEIVELHDEAYTSWRLGTVKGRWDRAEARAARLVERLGPRLPLYIRFFRADNRTASKERAPLLWFEQFVRERGNAVPPEPDGAE